MDWGQGTSKGLLMWRTDKSAGHTCTVRKRRNGWTGRKCRRVLQGRLWGEVIELHTVFTGDWTKTTGHGQSRKGSGAKASPGGTTERKHQQTLAAEGHAEPEAELKLGLESSLVKWKHLCNKWKLRKGGGLEEYKENKHVRLNRVKQKLTMSLGCSICQCHFWPENFTKAIPISVKWLGRKLPVLIL